METPGDNTGRPVTGVRWLDWLLGFTLTIVSPLLLCFGGMIPILAYFRMRERRSPLAQGIFAGLVTLSAAVFVGTLVLLATAKHDFACMRKLPSPPPRPSAPPR